MAGLSVNFERNSARHKPPDESPLPTVHELAVPQTNPNRDAGIPPEDRTVAPPHQDYEPKCSILPSNTPVVPLEQIPQIVHRESRLSDMEVEDAVGYGLIEAPRIF